MLLVTFNAGSLFEAPQAMAPAFVTALTQVGMRARLVLSFFISLTLVFDCLRSSVVS